MLPPIWFNDNWQDLRAMNVYCAGKKRRKQVIENRQPVLFQELR